MIQDVPYVQGQVNGRLVFFVQQKEEQQLLNGAGTGSELLGLLNRSGLTAAQAKATDTAIDAIYKEITKIRTSAFVDPSAIVMHPTDWQGIRLSKDANNQYFAGGPFTGAYGVGAGNNDRSVLGTGDNLWGLPVVVTTSATAGTAVVGAFNTCAEVFRKGGITVEATNSNENDFLTNLIAIRRRSASRSLCTVPPASAPSRASDRREDDGQQGRVGDDDQRRRAPHRGRVG
jgi:HK97 family phage major capsid protein